MLRDAHSLLREAAAILAVERPGLLPSLADLIAAVAPCRHSEDFTSIVWDGKPIQAFTPRQSEIVRSLWIAWERGTPEVRQQTLLKDLESETKLSTLFAGHPAWGVVIVQGTAKGTYRLADLTQI